MKSFNDMGKEKRNHFGNHLKMSCSALIVSSLFLGYDSGHLTFAEQNQSTNQDKHESELSYLKQHNKVKIDQLKNLNENEYQALRKQITQATSINEVERILKEAEKLNKNHKIAKEKDSNLISTSVGKSTQDDDVMSSLDQIIKDLENSNYDEPSEQSSNAKTDESTVNKNGTTTKESTDNSSTSSVQSDKNKILNNDKNDSLKNNTNDENDKTNIDDTLSKFYALSNDLKDNESKNKIENTHSEEQNTKDNQSNKKGAENEDSTQKALESNTTTLSNKNVAQEKIERAITQSQNQQVENERDYVDNRLRRLQVLENRIENDNALSQSVKNQLLDETQSASQDTKLTQDILLDNLKQAENKKTEVNDILNQVFSKNKSDEILKHINVKDKTDKQIANQLLREIDQHSTTTSDDILLSMFDQTDDKAELIKEILSIKRGENESSQIAKQLSNANLSNQQLVNKLKKEFGLSENASSDDILQSILKETSNPKSAVQTLLGSQLNENQARQIADMILRQTHNQDELLQLIKNVLNGNASDLIQAQNKLNSAKEDLDYVLSPIKNRPSLSEHMNDISQNHQTTPLLDGLNSDNNLLDIFSSIGDVLDDVDSIPNPTQGLSLSHINGNDSFLSGLFDDNGNLSLPNTGTSIKHHWPMITLGLALIGVSLVFFARYRQKSK